MALGIFASKPTFWRPFFPLPYHTVLQNSARKRGLDPLLVAAVVGVESGGNPRAVSDKGARGLMQLMPATASWAAQQQGLPAPQAEELFNPQENISLGTWYLAYLLRQYKGNDYLALAAYNAGEHNVNKWRATGVWQGAARTIADVPFKETRHFLRKVSALYGFYRWLYAAT